MHQAQKRQLSLRNKDDGDKRSYWDMLDIRVNPEVCTCPRTQCCAPYASLSQLPPLPQGPIKRSWDLLIVTLVLMLLVMVTLIPKLAPPPPFPCPARTLFSLHFEGPESALTTPPLTTPDSSRDIRRLVGALLRHDLGRA